MKKKSIRKPAGANANGDDLRSEYRIDYSKSKPNRFAARMPEKSVAVVLDPDVAEVFRDGKSVNGVLRALLTTMPVVR